MTGFIKKNQKSLIKIGIVIFIGLLLDQFLKYFFSSYHPSLIEKNTGIAFSIPVPVVIQIISTVILLLVGIGFVFKYFKIDKPSVQISFGAVLGGAVSNLTDRILNGFVIDYIDISAFINYPVFNLADVLIVLGIFYLVLFYGKISKDTYNKTK